MPNFDQLPIDAASHAHHGPGVDTFMWWSSLYLLAFATFFALALWFGCRGAMTYVVQQQMTHKSNGQQQQQPPQQRPHHQ